MGDETTDEKLEDVNNSVEVYLIKVNVTHKQNVAIVAARNELVYQHLPRALQKVLTTITEAMLKAADKLDNTPLIKNSETLVDRRSIDATLPQKLEEDDGILDATDIE